MCGASISVYSITAADRDRLDEFVGELHESFAFDVEAKLSRMCNVIEEFNSQGFFETGDMDVFRIRLIDKARLICSRFAKNGLLERLLQQPNDLQDDLAAAFLLGCLVTELHWIETHEEAVFEGWSHIEGREAGRPLATAARVRLGRRTRKAVLEAAETIYTADPFLRRNDSKTAQKIVSLKLEKLRKRDGTFLGAEAIIKHLRAERHRIASPESQNEFPKAEGKTH